MLHKTKSELVAEYTEERNKVQTFLQIDCYDHYLLDVNWPPGENEDNFTWQVHDDLRMSVLELPVRIQIHSDTPIEVARRLLEGSLECLGLAYETLVNELSSEDEITSEEASRLKEMWGTMDGDPDAGSAP